MELAEGSAQARSWPLEGSLRLSALRRERPTQVDRLLRRRLILLDGFAQAKLQRATGDGDVVWRVMRLGRSTLQSCSRIVDDGRDRGRSSSAKAAQRRPRWKALGRRTSLDVDAARKSKASWPRRHRKVEPRRQRVFSSRSLDLVIAESSGNEGARAERRAFAKALRTGLQGFGLGGGERSARPAKPRRTRRRADRLEARRAASTAGRLEDRSIQWAAQKAGSAERS